jgi:primosomal protein N' (replication factor Y)
MQKVLDAVHAGEADILVGTQMLAKGHDFPALTLVGVLDADGALYSADFRAAERLFAQLMQVAGRAGRAAAKGEVLVQTGFPDQPLFQTLQRHDYAAFAAQQLAERRAAGFPPFCHQALLRAEATRLAEALEFLHAARAALPGGEPGVVAYDPVPAPMARLAGRERAQLLLQSASRRALHATLAAWLPALRGKGTARVRWSLDVDPLEF